MSSLSSNVGSTLYFRDNILYPSYNSERKVVKNYTLIDKFPNNKLSNASNKLVITKDSRDGKFRFYLKIIFKCNLVIFYFR
jgi:hypothetical protein